jgi:hypothetical protein
MVGSMCLDSLSVLLRSIVRTSERVNYLNRLRLDYRTNSGKRPDIT